MRKTKTKKSQLILLGLMAFHCLLTCAAVKATEQETHSSEFLSIG